MCFSINLFNMINTLLFHKLKFHYCIVFFLPYVSYTQNFLERHEDYLLREDFDSVEINLVEWENSDDINEMFYVKHLNFYFEKSKNSIYYTNERRRDALKDSLGIMDYMSHMDSLELVFLKEAVDKVNQGLLQYPNRLDLIFGKLFTIRYHQEWAWLTKEILAVMTLSIQNDNQWLWEDNTIISEEEFLCTIEEHIDFLANHENDSLQFPVITISEAFLENYPNRHDAKFDLAIAYLLTGNLESGIQTLHELEQIFPENLDIVYNLAKAYQNNNEVEKAITYYEQMKGLGDQSAKKYAKKELRTLKKRIK